ncbi:MAG TPA: PIN domain-containing protein [Burkholderiales bacterium]|nr:PIN domain-containing protein [Burkholderiales bacterium]
MYSRDPRERAKQARADAWLDCLWRENRGRTSMQVLSEYYVNARRLGGVAADELWKSVERYLAWNPQPVDEPLLRRAHEVEQRWRLSWWDSMVVAAAQLQDCAVLLTEDLQDGGVYGTLTVRSPFTLSVEQPAPGYAATPLASRHRPRGRPKRSAFA